MGITFALAISNDIFIMSGPDVPGSSPASCRGSWSALLGLVFIATVAYVIAGPDGVKAKDKASGLPQAGRVPPQVPPSTISGP